MKLEKEFSKIDQINSNLLRIFLSPYQEKCRYLKMAQFQYPALKSSKAWSVEAQFQIPDSCYIQHRRFLNAFNGVEFNICYNQIYYITMAYLIESRLLEPMVTWDLDTYQNNQLSNFLITQCSTTFKKLVSNRKFYGTLKIKKCRTMGEIIQMYTSCAFYDIDGGWVEGDVTVAILNKNYLRSPKRTKNKNAIHIMKTPTIGISSQGQDI